MSSKDELVNLFRNQIKIEKTIVDSVAEGLADINNPAVKGVLKGITCAIIFDNKAKRCNLVF